MVFLKRFFCMNIRQGCILMSVLMSVVTLISLSIFLFYCVNIGLFKDDFDRAYLRYMAYSTLAAYGLICVASLSLVFGATWDKKNMILPWLLCITPVAIIDGFTTSVFTYESYENDKAIIEFVNTNLVVFVLRFSFWFFGFLCSSSQYLELAAGRGTCEYYKNKHRAVDVNDVAADIESRLNPPPYIEKPPSYRNIFSAVLDSQSTSSLAPPYTETARLSAVLDSHSTSSLAPPYTETA